MKKYKNRFNKTPIFLPTQVKGNDTTEGEPLEIKVARMLKNKEPIGNEKPLIYTERSKGVLAAYNIRTDRFEIATEAMDKITRSRLAARESKPKTEDKKEESKPQEGKIIDMKDGKPESTQGEVTK